MTFIVLPHEILQEIVSHLKQHEVLQLCLTHRSFYNHFIPRVYDTVHFLELKIKVPLEHKWLFEGRSTAITNLPALVRTLTSSDSLRSLLSEAAFQWKLDDNEIIKHEVLEILNLVGVSLKRLHYAPPDWDSTVPKSYPVTSAYLSCQSAHSIPPMETMYSLFSVPNLKHITLRRFQLGHEVGDRVDGTNRRSSSSLVEYLIIDDSFAFLRMLELLMSWFKALKAFHCLLGVREEGSGGDAMDASMYIRILQPQQATLEEVSLDFLKYTNSYGTLGTTLRAFPKLKRLSIPRQFLIRLSDTVHYGTGPDADSHINFADLHLALPPALEELVMNIDSDVIYKHRFEKMPSPLFWESLKKVACWKNPFYPDLKRIALWKRPENLRITSEDIYTKEQALLECVDVKSFEMVGVQLGYQICKTVPPFQIRPYRFGAIAT